MQWKIAVSWMSGYFIFQLFTPVLFKFHGPEVAGQMGITLAAINAIQGVCLIWPISKMPEFGRFINQKKWDDLDALSRKTLKQSLEICLLLLILFLIALSILKNISIIGHRFLPTWEVAIFSLSIFCQILISSWAMYMRAHKQEPMMLLSIIGGILTAISTLVLGYYFSSTGIVIGYLIINVLYGLPSTYNLFNKFKKFNHSLAIHKC
jgi:hypothetical protein